MPLLLLMGIGMYANPVLLFVAGIRRYSAREALSLRTLLGWVSLTVACMCFLAFVVGCGVSPQPATPAFDRWFVLWLRTVLILSGLSIVIGLFGRGKMQWVVFTSAFLTPMSLVLQKILE
jgi:hypothetical protein